jgi:acetyl-CoA/propionyl-CoA carboxylase carboxyl transferase subunit
MTATTDTKPVKPSREDDPRGPLKRLAKLFDDGSFELLTPFDDSGFVAAIGLVNGAKATSYASDPTIQGGAMGSAGCKAILVAYERALADGCPVIGLFHSGGARLAEGVLSLHAVGEVFAIMTRASGKVPQISVVLGPAAGGAAYGPALTDLVIMGPAGRVFVTGPDVVRSVTGEAVDMDRLGGPEPHGRRSGVVHVVAPTEDDAYHEARRLAQLLGEQGELDLSAVEDRDLAGLLPESVKRAYDVHPLSTGSSTSRASNCTRSGRRTSSPRSAASAGARSASSRTTRCASAAAWTRPRRRRRPASCACATRSACRWWCWWTCRATCRASARSGTALCGAAPSCCTPSPRPSYRASPW